MSKGDFRFNKKFKHQYINDNRFVSIYLDKEQNRIGFLFTQSPEKFSMKLILTKDDNCLLHGNVILKKMNVSFQSIQQFEAFEDTKIVYINLGDNDAN